MNTLKHSAKERVTEGKRKKREERKSGLKKSQQNLEKGKGDGREGRKGGGGKEGNGHTE